MLDLLKKIGTFRLDYNNWLLPLVFSGMSWVILPSIFLLSFPFFIPFFMGSKPIYRPLNILPVFLEIPPLLLYLHLHLGHCLPPSLHAMLSRWRGYWQILNSPLPLPLLGTILNASLPRSASVLNLPPLYFQNFIHTSRKILGILLG